LENRGRTLRRKCESISVAARKVSIFVNGNGGLMLAELGRVRAVCVRAGRLAAAGLLALSALSAISPARSICVAPCGSARSTASRTMSKPKPASQSEASDASRSENSMAMVSGARSGAAVPTAR
jgi:hypothetical protein